MKEILKFIKHSDDKEGLDRLLKENPSYRNLDRLAAQTISICSNVDFNIPVGEEEVNVCKAIEDMKADARSEGRNDGILTAVTMLKNMNLTKEAAAQQIAVNYSLSNEDAVAMVNSRW